MHPALSPIKLSEEDGYRILGTAGDRPPPKAIDGHAGFVGLRDMFGKGGGRIQDWKLIEHIESAKARGWPMLKDHEFRTKGGAEVAICGGGPSLAKPETLRELRRLQKRGVQIHAVNRTHDWLFTKGIRVDSAALLDPIPHVAKYITPRKGVRYYISSQCHPDTLDVFENYDKRLWHARASGAEEAVLTKEELDGAVASRTSSVGLRSAVLKYREGFRHIHLFGFDSSYDTDTIHDLFRKYAPPEVLKPTGEPLDEELGMDGKARTAYGWQAIGALLEAKVEGKHDVSLHAYLKPETVHDMRQFKLVAADGQRAVFYSNSAMACQAEEFQFLIKDIAAGIKCGVMEQVFMYVHGTGMLPCIAGFYGLHAKKGFNRCPTLTPPNSQTLTTREMPAKPQAALGMS